jgi:hypothetical protein
VFVMRGTGRKLIGFVAGALLALTVEAQFMSFASAQPANDGMYLRMRNAEARLNALENEQALGRLKDIQGPAAPAAPPFGSWIPGGALAGEDVRVQIEALQKQMRAQQKMLENLQSELARVCGAEPRICAKNSNP